MLYWAKLAGKTRRDSFSRVCGGVDNGAGYHSVASAAPAPPADQRPRSPTRSPIKAAS